MPVHSRLNYEILESILDFSDIRTIQTIRAVSPSLDAFCARYLSNAYNVALTRFVTNHVAFRSLLRLLGAAISGSFALNFLDRDRAHTWTSRDLDVYVPEEYGRRFIYHLLHVEQYVVLRHKKRPYTFATRPFGDVVTLVRGDVTIDVIISASASALLPIARFWGTHVMNYLTGDDFCIAYPDFTLRGRALLHPSGLIANMFPRAFTRDLMTKYEARGFEFRIRYTAWDRMYNVALECDGGSGCSRTVRFFGDKHCLLGSFHDGRSGFTWPGGLDDGGLTVVWWRGGDICGGRCRYRPDQLSSSIPHARAVPAERLLKFGLIVLSDS